MPTSALKERVTNHLEPIIAQLKERIQPIPEPQRFNHCVDVVTNWRGKYYYIKQKFKAADVEEERFFEVGLARITCNSANSFDLAYFRHTGKWHPIWVYDDSTLEEVANAILKEPIFEVF